MRVLTLFVAIALLPRPAAAQEVPLAIQNVRLTEQHTIECDLVNSASQAATAWSIVRDLKSTHQLLLNRSSEVIQSERCESRFEVCPCDKCRARDLYTSSAANLALRHKPFPGDVVVGQQKQLQALDDSGTTPDGLTSASSDTTVATVETTAGAVQVIQPGVATITASVGSFSAQRCRVSSATESVCACSFRPSQCR